MCAEPLGSSHRSRTMPTSIDPSELLRLNPKVKPRDLAASREMLRKLRENGLRGRGYRLAIPFSNRYAPDWVSGSEALGRVSSREPEKTA